MSKSIIQQLQNGVSLEELYRMFDEIPLQHLVENIRSNDEILKDLLSHPSQLLYTNMHSHHSLGSINKIKKSLKEIEKYLKFIVKDKLPIHYRFVISFIEFFGEYFSQEQVQESITNIQRAKHEVLVYNSVLKENLTTFLKCIDDYDQWVKALSHYIPVLSSKYEGQDATIFTALSKVLLYASEFLATQQQLKLAVELQMRNNQTIVHDISHIVSVSQNLIQNIISAQQFFQHQYTHSIKIINKY